MPGDISYKVVQETFVRKNVGIKIRQLRRDKKLNTVALASRAGISQGQLSKIENAKATVSIKNLTSLCSVLQIPLSYLFQTEDRKKPDNYIINAVAGLENQGLQWFAKIISDYTNGAVALKPLGPVQFGTSIEQINYGFKGNLDLFVESMVQFEPLAPLLKHLILPYCFRSEENRQAFFKTDYFKMHVTNPLLKNGIRLLNPDWNWMRGMERVILSRRPVISPKDVKGLRVRIYASNLLAEFWENMGAIPVTIPWPDVKDALKNKDFDLLPTMKSLLYHNEFCEHAKYITLLGDLPCILGVFMSDEKYRVFPQDIQNYLEKACDSAGTIFSQNVVLIEKKNEKLNLNRHGVAYLKVDKLPWHLKILEIRKKLMDQEKLSRQAWQKMETAC